MEGMQLWSHTDPQPFDAFDLVPPHHPSGEELRLLGGDRLAVHLPVGVQKMLGAVSHRLRQAVLDVLVGVAHLLDILSFEFLRDQRLILASNKQEVHVWI